MPLFKTILTYAVPSQAEVDQSFLEANGFTVYLMNSEVTRFEIGRALDVWLQVPPEQAAAATALLRQIHPERFGSVENVERLAKRVRTSAAWFVLLWAGSALLALLTWRTAGSLGERSLNSIAMGLPIAVFLWAGLELLKADRKKL